MIKQIGSVGCSNDENTFSSITHAVELGEQLTDNTIHDAAAVTLISTLGCDRVQFVEENNTRTGIAGALEDTTYIGFRLTNVHVE